jgi:hypothetical protein
MFMYGNWRVLKKKLGEKTTALGTFLGNSKNLIKFLKKFKTHQKRWKTEKLYFFSKKQQMTFKISIIWKYLVSYYNFKRLSKKKKVYIFIAVYLRNF